MLIWHMRVNGGARVTRPVWVRRPVSKRLFIESIDGSWSMRGLRFFDFVTDVERDGPSDEHLWLERTTELAKAGLSFVGHVQKLVQ
jgi:hypothetical protein